MIHIGVDPGTNGAIALIAADCVSTIKFSDTPHDIVERLSIVDPSQAMAYIERVSAMPRQGVSSTFKFGTAYGMCLGIFVTLRIPFEQVTPGKWQRFMGCLTRGDKNVTKRRAQELFPDLKITHAIADALLIAEYGRRIYASSH